MLRLLTGAAAALLLFVPGGCRASATTADGATGVPADAAAPGDRQVHWQRSLDDALALCAATGRPLFLALNMDGESASDRIVRENYRDPAFVALTRRCVCLGASLFRHNARDHDDDGRRIPCPRFGGITCGEHIALEPVLFEKYLSDGERVAPRHALVMPDGSKAFDLSLNFDLQDIDRALAAATTGMTPIEVAGGDSWAELAARRDHAGRARLEAAVAATQTAADRQAALAAIRAHGDAGAIEALRPLLAQCGELDWRSREQALHLAGFIGSSGDLFAVVRELTGTPGAVIGDPTGGSHQVLLERLTAEMSGRDDDLVKTRADQSFLLACCAGGLIAGPPEGSGLFFFFQQVVESVEADGGAVDFAATLQAAAVVSRTERDLPHTGGPADAMPDAATLHEELARLDAVGSDDRDAEWHARFAKASLDLGRHAIESGASNAQLLLEDAETFFGKALEREADRYEWWVERARAAYFLGRFYEQIRYGRRALQFATGRPSLPDERDLLGAPAQGAGALRDARVVEALRWIGDGCARILAARDPAELEAPPVDSHSVELEREFLQVTSGLRAYGVVCASPFGHDKDWQGFASLCGLLGLHRHQLAVAQAAVMRFPASNDLRQTLNAALWYCGRPDLSGAVAEAIEREHAPSADASWHAGYAWMLTAESSRRAEQVERAALEYDRADRWFARAAEQNPGYAGSCAYWRALAALGRGFAGVRAGDRQGAADGLATAVGLHGDLSQVTDGLGYDVLDLVDKIVEFRRTSEHFAPLDLLDLLDQQAPETPFWAAAVSDAALREALRADGRNPDKRVRETVDAGGDEIVVPMGLPTELGDEWLRQSIEAGRRAAQRAQTDDDRVPLAQSLTIQAERQLERGTLDGVRAALAEAAPLLGLAAPQEGADEIALRALTARLRSRLGPARPRLREGR